MPSQEVLEEFYRFMAKENLEFAEMALGGEVTKQEEAQKKLEFAGFTATESLI